MTETLAREAFGPDRRSFMAGAATAAIVVASGALIHSGEAWGLEVKNLKSPISRGERGVELTSPRLIQMKWSSHV